MVLTCDGRSPTRHPLEDLLGEKESEESAGAPPPALRVVREADSQSS